MTTTTQKFTFADLNDSQRQTLASRLIDAHPTRLQNTLVEFVLKMEHAAVFYGSATSYEDLPFTFDDITNNVAYGEVELSTGFEDLTEEERDQKVEELEEFEELTEVQQEDLEALEDMDFDSYPEIYQWFSCSDWLIRALEEKGECTLDDEFWGRQGCGQSIVLDRVIQEIAFEYACDYGKDYLTFEQVESL